MKVKSEPTEETELFRSRCSHAKRPWLFFGLTFGLSRLFWVPAAILRSANANSPVGLLRFLGGYASA